MKLKNEFETLIRHKCGHKVVYVTAYRMTRVQIDTLKDCVCAECRRKELMEVEDGEQPHPQDGQTIRRGSPEFFVRRGNSGEAGRGTSAV